MLFFSETEVRSLLPMDAAIDLMRRVFDDLAAGTALNQPRRRLALPTGAVLHSMAGAIGPYFGTKIYSTHPRGGAHFLFVLYRSEDGRPLALFEANHLGQIRTGACSGVATALLARDGARTACILGSGFQARSQLEAILKVRRVERVRVFSPTEQNRRRFAEETSRAFPARVEAAPSAEEAVRGADIIATATNAREPVLESAWVEPGAHINAIGSNQLKRRELPPDLLRRASLIAVDSIEQARIEAGDLLLAFGDDWTRQSIVELKDVASGKAARPAEPDAVTVFKSGGLGVEDVAVAGFVYEQAEKSGRKQPVVYS